MELLTQMSAFMQPYKEWVGLFAIIVTMLQLLSPSTILLDIRKKGSTKEVGIIPFLGIFVISVLFIKFGQLIGDDVTVKINFLGTVLGVIYICIYYFYTPIEDKFSVWYKIGAGFAFSVACIAYTNYEDPKLVEQRFGLFLTLLLYGLIASPLLDLGTVIRNKSTESLPFPMIFMGTLVGFAWLLYGVVLNNSFMVAQNVVATFLGAVQLLLFVIYPSKPAPKVKETKKKN